MVKKAAKKKSVKSISRRKISLPAKKPSVKKLSVTKTAKKAAAKTVAVKKPISKASAKKASVAKPVPKKTTPKKLLPAKVTLKTGVAKKLTGKKTSATRVTLKKVGSKVTVKKLVRKKAASTKRFTKAPPTIVPPVVNHPDNFQPVIELPPVEHETTTLPPTESAGASGTRFIDDLQVHDAIRNNEDALNEQREIVEALFRAHHDRLFALAEVTGLHVGFRRKTDSDGIQKIVDPLEYCIRVHVRKKYAKGDPRLENPFDMLCPGVPIDVYEESYLVGSVGLPGATTSIPVVGGIAIKSQQAAGSGTLGGIVYAGPECRFLTNQHVAGPEGSVVESVGSPGESFTQIGAVIESVRDHFIDAAIIVPEDVTDWEQSIDGINATRFENGELLPGVDDMVTVVKVGANSGFTKGLVESADCSVMIDGFPMLNQILIRKANPNDPDIAEPGDSGSLVLVLTEDNRGPLVKVVGLIHSVSTNEAEQSTGASYVACHFHRIKSRFHIDS